MANIIRFSSCSNPFVLIYTKKRIKSLISHIQKPMQKIPICAFITVVWLSARNHFISQKHHMTPVQSGNSSTFIKASIIEISAVVHKTSPSPNKLPIVPKPQLRCALFGKTNLNWPKSYKVQYPANTLHYTFV